MSLVFGFYVKVGQSCNRGTPKRLSFNKSFLDAFQFTSHLIPSLTMVLWRIKETGGPSPPPVPQLVRERRLESRNDRPPDVSVGRTCHPCQCEEAWLAKQVFPHSCDLTIFLSAMLCCFVAFSLSDPLSLARNQRKYSSAAEQVPFILGRLVRP